VDAGKLVRQCLSLRQILSDQSAHLRRRKYYGVASVPLAPSKPLPRPSLDNAQRGNTG
jgi:hypothetical protein